MKKLLKANKKVEHSDFEGLTLDGVSNTNIISENLEESQNNDIKNKEKDVISTEIEKFQDNNSEKDASKGEKNQLEIF